MAEESFRPVEPGLAPVTKKRKRNRETLSCLPCRDRKVGCDRGHPCSSCVRHKRQEDCHYSARVSMTDRKPSDGIQQACIDGSIEENDISERIARIERALSASDKPQSTTPLSAQQQKWFNTPTNGCSVDPGNVADTRVYNNLNRSPPALGSPANSSGINTLCGGKLCVKQDGTPYYIGSTAWSLVTPLDVFSDPYIQAGIMDQWKRTMSMDMEFGRIRPHETIMSVVVDGRHGLESSGTSGDEPVQQLIPNDAACRLLAANFLTTINELLPLVDKSEFEEQLETYLTDRSATAQGWVALLAAILAIGHLVPVQSGLTNLSADRSMARQLISYSRHHTFVAAASTHRARLESVQTLLAHAVFHGLDFGWTDGNSSVSGSLGLANRLVFTLGLHRDPSINAQQISAAEATTRRKVFMTYLFLEYSHSTETGMPMLFRHTDFDVDLDFHPGGGSKSNFQADFLRLFPLLSKVLHITHSARATVSDNEIRDLLSSLQLAGAAIQVSQIPPEDPTGKIIFTLQSSFNVMLVYRAHNALLTALLDHADKDICTRTTNDMVSPSVAIFDGLADMFKIIEQNAAPEVVDCWQTTAVALTRSTVFHGVAFVLSYLQKSLVNTKLWALRGTSSAAWDSAQIFRKIRMVQRLTRCAITAAVSSVRHAVAYAAFLRCVEERYRLFVERDVTDVDLRNSEDGKSIIKAIGVAMSEVLDDAEATLRAKQAPLPPAANEAPAFEMTDGQQVDLMQSWDWPWYDMMTDQGLWLQPPLHDWNVG